MENIYVCPKCKEWRSDPHECQEPLSSDAVLGEGWRKPDKTPDFYKPIVMLIETTVIGTIHEIYIAGYYHTDKVYCESCGGCLDKEFDNYKLKAWAYINGPAFA